MSAGASDGGPGAGGDRLPAAIPVRLADPLQMAWYELSDLGNAERLRDRADGRLLWVEGRWLAYDGVRWSAEDGQRLAQVKAHEVARGISAEAAALAEDSERRARERLIDKAELERCLDRVSALHKHGVITGNANRTAAMLAQAQAMLFAARDDFDRDPLAINAPNGTVRIVKGRDGRWTARLDPHDPADLLSRVTAAPWRADAPAPAWDRHLATVLPDAAVRAFFAEICGYGATGLITEQAVFILQGKGGDGKSTTTGVLRELLGGYAAAPGVDTFLAGAQRSGSEASPDLARLAGDCRFVSTGEPRIGASLDEARIKQATGGAPIAARELNKPPFEYIPRFKLFFECNRKPRISGDDDGIWRRVVVVHFPHQFKGQAADKSFAQVLLAEAEGVFAWMVRGAIAWLDRGRLEPPPAVVEAIDDYRRASNPFGEWFQERVDTRDPEARTLSAALYADYKSFCEENAATDREIMSSTAFGRALGDKQLIKVKNRLGKIERRGARLRDGAEPASAAAPPPAVPGDWTEAPPGPDPLDDWDGGSGLGGFDD